MAYNVYVTRNQISRSNRTTYDNETVAYKATVNANSFREASDKCIEKIWSLCDADIKIISVYVGIKGSVSAAANRMQPLQYRR